MKNRNLLHTLLCMLSYVLVAALASCATLFLFVEPEKPDKVKELRTLIQNRFIGEVTDTQLNDGAAAGMVAATGDRWSYYIPASEYASHMEQMKNEYVGIGVTISSALGEKGFQVLSVDPQGGAYDAGILAGDVISKVAGQSVLDLGADGAKEQIRGDADTSVKLTVLRGEEELELDVVRKRIQVIVAKGEMLPDSIGLVTIENFDDRCASETLAAIQSLVEQGAKALIFDVRFNPGGYKTELVEVWITCCRKDRSSAASIMTVKKPFRNRMRSSWSFLWQCWSMNPAILPRNSLRLL